jgi:xanthosine utilization system XapX-like protein
MVDRCPRCGLRFEQDEGSRLGSAMVNYAVVAGALVAYIVVSLIVTLPDPPVLPLVGGACAVVVIVAVIFFPFGKTIWSAMDLAMKGFDVGDRPSPT